MTRDGRQGTGAIREGIVPLDRQFTAGFSDLRLHKVTIWFCLADLVGTSGRGISHILIGGNASHHVGQRKKNTYGD
jgi:hypothetical protein